MSVMCCNEQIMRDCESGTDKIKEHLDPSKDIGGQWRTLGSPVLSGVENNLRKYDNRRKIEILILPAAGLADG